MSRQIDYEDLEKTRKKIFYSSLITALANILLKNLVMNHIKISLFLEKIRE